MGCHVEVKTLIIRFGPDLHKFGDPYIFQCHGTNYKGRLFLEAGRNDTDEVLNLFHEFPELREKLDALEFKDVEFTRKKPGKPDKTIILSIK